MLCRDGAKLGDTLPQALYKVPPPLNRPGSGDRRDTPGNNSHSSDTTPIGRLHSPQPLSASPQSVASSTDAGQRPTRDDSGTHLTKWALPPGAVLPCNTPPTPPPQRRRYRRHSPVEVDICCFCQCSDVTPIKTGFPFSVAVCFEYVFVRRALIRRA